MEELNLTVNGIQDKVAYLGTEIAVVQDKQKTLDGKFSHIVKNAEFVDEQIIELKTALQTSANEFSESRKRVLYLGGVQPTGEPKVPGYTRSSGND